MNVLGMLKPLKRKGLALKRIYFIGLIFSFLVLSASTFAADPPASIPLWEKGAPGSEAKKDAPEVVRTGNNSSITMTSIHNPAIIPYLAPIDKAIGVAVLVFPGGGHSQLSIGHEGYTVGEWLSSHGISAFVVKYRLAREQGSTYKPPISEWPSQFQQWLTNMGFIAKSK